MIQLNIPVTMLAIQLNTGTHSGDSIKYTGNHAVDSIERTGKNAGDSIVYTGYGLTITSV
jgi:hypothetical protein